MRTPNISSSISVFGQFKILYGLSNLSTQCACTIVVHCPKNMRISTAIVHITPSLPPAAHSFAAATTRSGSSDFTFVTIFKSSLTTSSPLASPAFLIASICSSASFFASSSACLLPLVCYTPSKTSESSNYYGIAREVGVIGRADRRKRTFSSNFLNSSSFCLRYSSTSFCASLFASFTRFERS